MQSRTHPRTRALPCALLAALVVPFALSGCERGSDAGGSSNPAAGSARDARRDPYQDELIAQWMSGCARTEPFLEDTSEPIVVLVSKLAAGDVEPLRGARTELAALGEKALPELQRLFESSYGEPFLAPRLQNVVEVVGAMRTDAGRGLLLRALEHPQPGVRAAAARALALHARPADYDALLAAMPHSVGDAQGDFALALLAADRARLELDFAAWVQDDALQSIVRVLAPHLVGAHGPALRTALEPLLPTLTGEMRVHALAIVAAGSGVAGSRGGAPGEKVPVDGAASDGAASEGAPSEGAASEGAPSEGASGKSASSGSPSGETAASETASGETVSNGTAAAEAAMSQLRTWLRDASNPSRQEVVAHDLARAGLTVELGRLLEARDPNVTLRKVAVQAVASAPFDERARELLRGALADPSEEVREIALATLAAHRDANAIDVALEGLAGARTELDASLRALRPAMAVDAALAERVLDRLIDVRAGKLGKGLVEDRTLLRAIGQVPLARAARIIMDEARDAHGEIAGQPTHRWMVSAAGNTGREGLAYLRSLWAQETDPARRMDLVLGGTFERSAETRAFLAEVVASERSTPPEVLFAASRLSQFGPSSDVAPLLKRVALRIDDPRIRPALNCLLWTWYGKST